MAEPLARTSGTWTKASEQRSTSLRSAFHCFNNPLALASIVPAMLLSPNLLTSRTYVLPPYFSKCYRSYSGDRFSMEIRPAT